MYKIHALSELITPPGEPQAVRWLEMPEDLPRLNRHLEYRGKPEITLGKYESWLENANYCGLFLGEKMVARGAVERYSEDAWETADIATLYEERGHGYAKQIAHFVTKHILERGKIATCRTLKTNLAMQRVLTALGFVETGEIEM
jgi:RimJ/RimL family protein N-acetyltransferase